MKITMEFKGDFSALKNIQKAAERKEEKMLGFAAGYIRRTAMSSMKRGSPGQTSLPGGPPLFWTERYRHSIQYAYDRSTRSVVIGGISYNGIPVPGFIERGGMELVTKKTGRQFVGQYRPRPAMQLALAVAIQQRKVQEALKDYITL